MRIISNKKLCEAAKFSDVISRIDDWCSVGDAAKWNNLVEVQKTYRTAEAVENFTVFNIKSYRLIVGINYEKQIVYFKYFLTHAEYDKGAWKNDPYF